MIPAAVAAMAQHPHNAGVQEHGCKVLANLAHHYTNCALISEAGGIEVSCLSDYLSLTISA